MAEGVARMPSATSPSRRGRPGYDYDAVLRSAIELFNDRGYDATSIADLAQHMGLTKSAIFHHVASKEDLLAAALDEALDALSLAVSSATDRHRGETALERLRGTVRESVLILASHLPAVTLLLRVHGNSEVELAALERRRLIDEELAMVVKDAVDEGGLRDDLPPRLITRLLFGAVNSLVEWYGPDGPISPVELADAVTAMAFEGLVRRKGAVRRRKPAAH